MEPTEAVSVVRVDHRGFVWYGNARLPIRVVDAGFEFPTKGRTQREQYGDTITVPKANLIEASNVGDK